MKRFTLEKSIPLTLTAVESVPSKYISTANFTLVFSMITEAEDDTPESLMQAQIEQNVSFAKACAFMDGVVNNSVLISHDLEDLEGTSQLQDFLQDYENNIIVLPDLHDSTLITALHCKLNAIIHKTSHVERITLTDNDQNITFNYVSTDDDSIYPELPESQSEWLGEHSYFEQAWWHRADTSTLDRAAEGAEEVAAWNEAAASTNYAEMSMMMFTEIDDTIRAMFNNDYSEGEGAVIEVDFTNKNVQNVWTPTVV
jgi:hypothetical protein